MEYFILKFINQMLKYLPSDDDVLHGYTISQVTTYKHGYRIRLHIYDIISAKEI